MKYWRMNTINGDHERKVEISITDGGFQIRWPKYNLLGLIFRRFFTVIITDHRAERERQVVIDASVKEYDYRTNQYVREY